MHQPTNPTEVTLTTRPLSIESQVRGTSLDIFFQPPADIGGDPVQRYLIEWCEAPTGGNPLWGREERQFVEIVHDNGGVVGSGSPPNITGWFRLELDTTACDTCNVKLKRKTGRIRPWASAREVQIALNNLENAGHVDVERQKQMMRKFEIEELVLDTSELIGFDAVNTKVTEMASGSVPTRYCDSHDHEHTYCPEMLAEEGDLETNVFMYTINGLVPGREYFTRVQAANELGYGKWRRSIPESRVPPIQMPAVESAVADPKPSSATTSSSRVRASS